MCVYVIINIYTYMYMMYIYAYHIIPLIIIYICGCSMDCWKKHNIPLINNVVALYAILPLREFGLQYFFERVLLTTCRHVFSGNFLAKKLRKEALQDNGCNTVCVKIRATPLCFIGYWVCTFCPEKPTGKYCTGTGWGIIVELPKYWSVIDSLKHN